MENRYVAHVHQQPGMIPSSTRRKIMLVWLLWIGIFFDVLSSFSLPPPMRIVASTLPQCHHMVNVESGGSTCYTTDTITILVPPALEVDEGYPSPLHSIHVCSLMTPEQASKCCEISQAFALETGRWESPDEERHQTYPTCDFPVDECQALQDYLEEMDFDDRLFSKFSELYGVDVKDMEYLDLFVAHYQAKDESGTKSMDRLELHRDGSLFSFSLLLNDPNDFQGGGTFYDALRDVVKEGSVGDPSILHPGGVIRPTRAGDACLHCGKLLHGADVVTSGSRTVLVGFVDVASHCYRPGVLARACTEWGRMDVAVHRLKRQESKANVGWKLGNAKWFSQQQQPSVYRQRWAPAFSSATRRAAPEFQRQKKLQAEDTMLRTILLPPEERMPDLVEWDGDITILEDEEAAASNA